MPPPQPSSQCIPQRPLHSLEPQDPLSPSRLFSPLHAQGTAPRSRPNQWGQRRPLPLTHPLEPNQEA